MSSAFKTYDGALAFLRDLCFRDQARPCSIVSRVPIQAWLPANVQGLRTGPLFRSLALLQIYYLVRSPKPARSRPVGSVWIGRSRFFQLSCYSFSAHFAAQKGWQSAAKWEICAMSDYASC